MIRIGALQAMAFAATTLSGVGVVQAVDLPCAECLSIRVGPPMVARGPFPDELDGPMTALKLADGTFRAFSANGLTYAIDTPSLTDLDGPRRAVLRGSEPGGISDCGRWLTSTMRLDGAVLGMVHQERDCDYQQGRTNKSLAIAISVNDGLKWSEPQTVLTGTDSPQPDRITGEGDCTMVDGEDGYLYAYCLRNSDWQTIVARAEIGDPGVWYKYFEGGWTEPGLGGRATAIGFLGPGAGYLERHGLVAALASDRWFNGLRLSLSSDKVTFVDVDEPLLTIDDSDWARPAATDLIAYANVINPDTGGNAVGDDFLVSYIYVPPGLGFEHRYLVLHEVSLSMNEAPPDVQVGQALTRWVDPARERFISSTGPLTGDREAYERDALVAYMLTRAPDGLASVKLEECLADGLGQLLTLDGRCGANGYVRERTSGWLYAQEQPGSVPVYQCQAATSPAYFVSGAHDCEGLGSLQALLGYGLAP